MKRLKYIQIKMSMFAKGHCSLSNNTPPLRENVSSCHRIIKYTNYKLEIYMAVRKMALLRALKEANQTLWLHRFKFIFVVRINRLSRDEAHLSNNYYALYLNIDDFSWGNITNQILKDNIKLTVKCDSILISEMLDTKGFIRLKRLYTLTQ